MHTGPAPLRAALTNSHKLRARAPSSLLQYCCTPLRTEPPTDAWYCAECDRARAAVAARLKEAAAERAAARRAATAARRQEREARRRLRRQAAEQRRRQAREELAAARRQALPDPAAAAANGSTPPSQPRTPQLQGLGQQQPAKPAGPGPGVASKDTLALVFQALSGGGGGSSGGGGGGGGKAGEEGARGRQREASRVDGASRSWQRVLSRQEAERGALAATYSLARCRQAGALAALTLRLPAAAQVPAGWHWPSLKLAFSCVQTAGCRPTQGRVQPLGRVCSDRRRAGCAPSSPPRRAPPPLRPRWTATASPATRAAPPLPPPCGRCWRRRRRGGSRPWSAVPAPTSWGCCSAGLMRWVGRAGERSGVMWAG
jgi:hypothetical protein